MKQHISLYVFVTSDIPDVYINTIGYCVDHYHLDKITFLGIVKDRGQKTSTEKYVKEVKSRVLNQLSSLQKGEFLYRKNRKWENKKIEIKSHDKLRYAKIAEQKYDSNAIVYSDLEKVITDYISVNKSESIFDLSAILKGYMIDVYTILLSKRISEIYAFELKLKGRTYDEKELIHNLSIDSGDYEFVNLTKSNYTKNKIIKTQEAEKSMNIKVTAFEKEIEVFASNFASTMLAIYSVIVLLSFLGLILLVSRSNWNDIEPWTFLIFGAPFFSYLVSLAIQVIFKKEFSVKPKTIFNLFKNYKLKQLFQKFNL